jgi:hypothetical protein
MTLCSKFALKQGYKLIELIRFLRKKQKFEKAKELKLERMTFVCVHWEGKYVTIILFLRLTSTSLLMHACVFFYQGVGIRKSVGMGYRVQNKPCIYENCITKTMGWSSFYKNSHWRSPKFSSDYLLSIAAHTSIFKGPLPRCNSDNKHIGCSVVFELKPSFTGKEKECNAEISVSHLL